MAWLRQQWERFMRWVNHSDDPQLPSNQPPDQPEDRGPE